MPVSLEWLETRTKESKHARKFLTIFTRLEPTAIGGELWIACTGTGVSTGGRAHSSHFLQYGPRSPIRVYKFSARRTTDHDLVSVIPDEKVGERVREGSQRKNAYL